MPANPAIPQPDDDEETKTRILFDVVLALRGLTAPAGTGVAQRATRIAPLLTNLSGVDVVEGDVVILGGDFTLTFDDPSGSPFYGWFFGVVLESIADGEQGHVCFFGPVPKVNLTSSASAGAGLQIDFSAPFRGVPNADLADGYGIGTFGVSMEAGTSPSAFIFGWVAKGVETPALGDLQYYDGTQWVRLPAGTPGQVLTMSVGGLPSWV